MTGIGRRGFLAGIGALLAAPAVVRVDSLMPVRGLIMPLARVRRQFECIQLLDQPFDLAPGATVQERDFVNAALESRRIDDEIRDVFLRIRFDSWPSAEREACEAALRRKLFDCGSGARIVADENSVDMRHDLAGRPLQLSRFITVEMLET